MVAGVPLEGAGLESRNELPMCKRALERGDELGVRRYARESGCSDITSFESEEMGGRCTLDASLG